MRGPTLSGVVRGGRGGRGGRCTATVTHNQLSSLIVRRLNDYDTPEISRVCLFSQKYPGLCCVLYSSHSNTLHPQIFAQDSANISFIFSQDSTRQSGKKEQLPITQA